MKILKGIWGFFNGIRVVLGVSFLAWLIGALVWVFDRKDCSIGLLESAGRTWLSKCSESLKSDLSDRTVVILLLVALALTVSLPGLIAVQEGKRREEERKKERRRDRRARRRQHKELVGLLSELVGRSRYPRDP